MSEQHPEATETLLYTFDLPTLTDGGSIHITDNGIILQFPEIPPAHVPESIKVPQNINVFIEKHLRISLAWIPVHTWADYFRVKDMFNKCLQSYCYLLKNIGFTPHTFLSNPARSYECLTYESINSSYLKPDEFNLTCFEHIYDTCIQLSLYNHNNNNNKEPTEQEIPLHFQICFGRNIVFCTERDLSHVKSSASVHFLVQFILYKISQNL
jgi:hypothetical protein